MKTGRPESPKTQQVHWLMDKQVQLHDIARDLTTYAETGHIPDARRIDGKVAVAR